MLHSKAVAEKLIDVETDGTFSFENKENESPADREKRLQEHEAKEKARQKKNNINSNLWKMAGGLTGAAVMTLKRKHLEDENAKKKEAAAKKQKVEEGRSEKKEALMKIFLSGDSKSRATKEHLRAELVGRFQILVPKSRKKKELCELLEKKMSEAGIEYGTNGDVVVRKKNKKIL